jgi:hypothetical protein
MAVIYGTKLQARAPDRQGPARLEAIAQVVGGWAGVSDVWSTTARPGKRGAEVTTAVLTDDHDGSVAWTMRFTHLDQTDKSIQWTVGVSALAGETTDIALQLDRARIDGALHLPREQLKPPGCLRALLESDQLVIEDAERRVGTSVWVVDEAQAEPLARLVLAADRRLPIIGFTTRDDDAIDGGVMLDNWLSAFERAGVVIG